MPSLLDVPPVGETISRPLRARWTRPGLPDYFRSTSEFEILCEWVRLDASRVRNNLVCVKKHQKRLRAFGESARRLSELPHWNQSSAFTEREKVALRLSEIISLDKPKNLSALIIKAAQRYFSSEEIIQLALAVMAVNDWIDLQEKQNAVRTHLL